MGAITQAEATAAAAMLMDEYASGARFTPFADRCSISSLDDAYAVQDAFVRLQKEARGVETVGYKLGLTSKRMQQMCGTGQPIAGVILSDRVHASGARVSRGDFGHVGVEFEIAVRMADDLVPVGRPVALEDVAKAVGAVCPAFEIVDDRNCDYSAFDTLSAVADNSWNAGVVVGEFHRPWPDLAEILGVVSVDGAEIDRGTGRDILGHPFNSVAWIANHLAERGERLRDGDLVMTGSMVTTRFPEGRWTCRFEVSGLGSVDLAVEP